MLCAEANDSIVALDFTEIGLQKVFGISGRNEMTGTYGRCLDDLLIKKPLRKCRVLGNYVGFGNGESFRGRSF